MKQQKILPSLFSSPDLALATTLIIYGYPVESIERSTKKNIFYFKRDEKLDDLIQKYFSHQLVVEPNQYFNTLRELKTRMYHI